MVNAPVSGVVVTSLTSWRFLGSSPRFVAFMLLKFWLWRDTYSGHGYISIHFADFSNKVTLSQSSFYYVISLIDVWDSDWWCTAVHNLWSQSLHFIPECRVAKEIQSHRWNGWPPFAAVFAVVHCLKKWPGCADAEAHENFVTEGRKSGLCNITGSFSSRIQWACCNSKE